MTTNVVQITLHPKRVLRFQQCFRLLLFLCMQKLEQNVQNNFSKQWIQSKTLIEAIWKWRCTRCEHQLNRKNELLATKCHVFRSHLLRCVFCCGVHFEAKSNIRPIRKQLQKLCGSATIGRSVIFSVQFYSKYICFLCSTLYHSS